MDIQNRTPLQLSVVDTQMYNQKPPRFRFILTEASHEVRNSWHFDKIQRRSSALSAETEGMIICVKTVRRSGNGVYLISTLFSSCIL